MDTASYRDATMHLKTRYLTFFVRLRSNMTHLETSKLCMLVIILEYFFMFRVKYEPLTALRLTPISHEGNVTCPLGAHRNSAF